MIRGPTELEVRRDCRYMVSSRSLASAGAAVVPLPGADLVADVGLHSDMLLKISEQFELDHNSNGEGWIGG